MLAHRCGEIANRHHLFNNLRITLTYPHPNLRMTLIHPQPAPGLISVQTNTIKFDQVKYRKFITINKYDIFGTNGSLHNMQQPIWLPT